MSSLEFGGRPWKLKAASLGWLGLWLVSASVAEAAGLSTEFGEVNLKDLAIGQRYTLQELMGTPFRVENTGSTEPVQLRIEIQVPQPSELKPGFEAIPEASWLTLERSEFTLAPKEEAVTDLILAIPEDPTLEGRKFQVYLWAHTTGSGVGVGLRSRFLLEIAG